MCNRHSFIVTRVGKVFDGCGITESHTTIKELAGLSAENDTVNAYEWQPPKGWPDADWEDGLMKDVEVFEVKSRHLNAMKHHVVSLYPDLATWDHPDKIHGDLTKVTILRGELRVPAGATLTLPALTTPWSCKATLL